MHLELKATTGESLHVKSTDPIIGSGWNTLQVVVDLSKNTVADAVKMYRDTHSGNFFGDGTDTASGDTTVISANTSLAAVQDGDMVVRQYKNLTINSGCTLSTDKRCRGMLLFVKGDLTVNGTLSMSARGCAANPADSAVTANTLVAPGDGQAVSSSGLKLGFVTATGTESGTTDLNGTGMMSVNMAGNFPVLDGNGKIITVSRTGGAGSPMAGTSSTTGVDAVNTEAGKSGGGGSGGQYNYNIAGRGGAGTCFSGGTGGGGGHILPRTEASDFGGKGGQLSYTGWGAGGAGNPGGEGFHGQDPGEDGTGGLMIIVVSGDITVGAEGKIESGGKAGGRGYYGGGGGSGGGNIVIAHGGNLTNNGAIEAPGGLGGKGSDNEGS
jgi:hypothetical protein